MTDNFEEKRLPSSFRDRDGFIFTDEGKIYRQINNSYSGIFETFTNSGLYERLSESGQIIRHSDVSGNFSLAEGVYKIIEPEPVPFISYPYEWSFSQYKQAALLLLGIQRTALDYDMTLKDASAYNIQFVNGRPVLIDTLSFTNYEEGSPWVAYRQFCQHFLAPLALMSYKDIRLGQLMKIYIDGLPLDLVSSLLPFKTKMKFSVFSHIHLHSKVQRKYGEKQVKTSDRKISRLGLTGIIDNLTSSTEKLNLSIKKSEWSNYNEIHNYTDDGVKHKREIVSKFLDFINPRKSLWDLGANTGEYSRIAAGKGFETVSFDSDPLAVEINYQETINNNEQNLLPLLCDLTNPSPAVGWENKERDTLFERGPANAVLALALIHHLAISNNVPLSNLARFFNNICRYLIIEFVPKTDSQVKRLLLNREDIFSDYDQKTFEEEFKNFFTIEKSEGITDSQRTVYLMRKKGN